MASVHNPPRKVSKVALIVGGLTALFLLLSLPASIRYARESGSLYLFSHDFIKDIPKRLTGPGRFRFVLQPLIATVLGVRSGRADARTGRPPYLYGVLFKNEHRRVLMKDAFATIAILLMMGILLDSICQWLIFGISYPGAALVVGPVLIVTPYTVARALTNRLSR